MKRLALALLLGVASLAPFGQAAQGAPTAVVDGGFDQALERLGDPSVALRLRIAAAADLAAPDAGLKRADERAELLAERARLDPSGELRTATAEALALVEGPRASALLAELVASLPGAEAEAAAKLLAKRSSAARELLDLLADGLGEQPLPAPTLTELLGGLGQAFASRGEARDHLLFTRARLHAAPVVRAAADRALEQALTRLGTLRLDARAVALLEALEDAPWPATELLVRRAMYHVSSGRDLEAALEATARTERLTRGRQDFPGRRTRFLASYLQAATLFGLGRNDEVFAPLMRASMSLDGLATERLDLSPSPELPSAVTARRMTEVLELRGLVELLAACAALAGGAETNDPRVLMHLQQAHEFSLWAQLREAAVDDKAGLGGIDVVLDGALSPRRLVLSAPDNPIWSGERRGAGLDLMLDLGRAFRVVLGEELPGFEPRGDLAPGPDGEPSFGPARTDPRRFALLKMMREAQAMAIQRRLEVTWDQLEMQMLDLRGRAVAEAIERDRESNWEDLADLRLPSIYALLLAGDLRADDRAEEAVELCARLHADLEESGSYGQGAWGAWLAARVEIAHGGALGDAGRPREAIEVFDSAQLRLEAVENTILERKRQERDPRSGVIYDQQLVQTRALRAQALVGMAVNSNVRLGDPGRALGYFERAYELDQSDFMRGLLACYRARFGAEDEARALLRTVRPAPEVYYNLACAHALLGELDQALGMLRRELDENHPTPGSLARQKRWSREDPDLANLWEDPRFVLLTE